MRLSHPYRYDSPRKVGRQQVKFRIAFLVVLCATAPTVTQAWELTGSVRVADGVEPAESPAAIAAATIVYFEPDSSSGDTSPTAVDVAMQRKEFVPRVAVATPGSSVRFPNRDPILHNVFSVSAPNEFDLGLYRSGEGEAVMFEQPGVVRVFCNVHHSMVAYVLVVDTPHFARVGVDGSFKLTGLPPGGGRLTVWHDRSEPWSRAIEGSTGPVAVDLTIDRARVPRHANKFGKPYANDRRRAY